MLTERMLSKGPVNGWPLAFDAPTIFPGRIAEAARWKDLTGTAREAKPCLDGMRRVIFVNNMGDTYTASLPVDWLASNLPLMAATPHRWLILTKAARPPTPVRGPARTSAQRLVWHVYH